MARIKYTCKNCGWNRSVPMQWADIKPKRCMNAKCNTSFAKEPKSLIVDDSSKITKNVKTEVAFEGKPNKLNSRVEKDEESDSKSKRSSKTKQQSKKSDKKPETDKKQEEEQEDKS